VTTEGKKPMLTTTTIRTGLAVLLLALAAGATQAQLAPPNERGVAMGHVHFMVRDLDANARFWAALGGREAQFGANRAFVFPDMVVLLREGEPSGTSRGAVVDHVALRVRSLAALEELGLEIRHLENFPGVAYLNTPEGEMIELFDDGLADNLWFEIENGELDEVADRHNRPMPADIDIVANHIHLYVPEGEVDAAVAWYADHFGGVAGMRWRYPAVDLPGMNLNFSESAEPRAPTQGRMLDHIGFEIENLEAFCRALEANGIVFDRPYSTLASGFGLAFLTDPWGTYIELTEGLREL
jgi:catechol 2,3-dioxygenase-like lactoylglutathione lyase family enzyme